MSELSVFVHKVLLEPQSSLYLKLWCYLRNIYYGFLYIDFKIFY